MKTHKKLLRKLCVSLGCSFIFLCSTAGSCDCGSNGNSEPNPSIESTYTETWDMEITNLFLRYNMTIFLRNCERNRIDPSFDMLELQNNHGIGPYVSWLDFNQLLWNAENYSGNDGSMVKFVFKVPYYSGEKTYLYDRFDEKLCLKRLIAEAPRITQLHYCDFFCKTITTAQNNVCLKWTGRIEMDGYNTVTIDKYGEISSSCFFSTGVSSPYRGGISIAARLKNNNGDGNIEVVENTVSDGLSDGRYKPISISQLQVVSSLLTQKICIAGSVSETSVWDAPYIINLEEI